MVTIYMKKRHYIRLFLVCGMVGTVLSGCANKEAVMVESVVESLQEEMTESVEKTDTEERDMDNTAQSPEIINTDGTFFGLEITPSGAEKKVIWREKDTEGYTEAVANSPIIAEVSTRVNEEGMYEKNVKYTVTVEHAGEFVFRIFDYATGEDIMFKEGCSISKSEREVIYNGSSVTNIFTVTFVTPEEMDSVFFYTQNTTELKNTVYDTSYFVEQSETTVDFQTFLDTCKLDENSVLSDYIHLVRN